MNFKTKLDYYIHMKFETISEFVQAFTAYAEEHGVETKANRNNIYLWRRGECFPKGPNRTILSAVLEEDPEELFPMEDFYKLNKKKK